MRKQANKLAGQTKKCTMYNSYTMKPTAHLSSQDLMRTQIYLSSAQQTRLAQLAERTDETKSGLIRLAIDHFLEAQAKANAAGNSKKDRLAKLAGVWSDKAPIDLRELRSGWSQRGN